MYTYAKWPASDHLLSLHAIQSDKKTTKLAKYPYYPRDLSLNNTVWIACLQDQHSYVYLQRLLSVVVSRKPARSVSFNSQKQSHGPQHSSHDLRAFIEALDSRLCFMLGHSFNRFKIYGHPDINHRGHPIACCIGIVSAIYTWFIFK